MEHKLHRVPSVPCCRPQGLAVSACLQEALAINICLDSGCNSHMRSASPSVLDMGQQPVCQQIKHADWLHASSCSHTPLSISCTFDLSALHALGGMQVIYGDTDSIMIATGSTDVAEVVAIGARVKREVEDCPIPDTLHSHVYRGSL